MAPLLFYLEEKPMEHKTLDFNSLQRPCIRLTMADENRTEILVTTPTEALVEKLEAVGPELQAACKTGNREAINTIYELAAKLISCNRSGLAVSAEDLRDKYNLDLESMIVFYKVYMDFINEIYNAKN